MWGQSARPAVEGSPDLKSFEYPFLGRAANIYWDVN